MMMVLMDDLISGSKPYSYDNAAEDFFVFDTVDTFEIKPKNKLERYLICRALFCEGSRHKVLLRFKYDGSEAFEQEMIYMRKISLRA